MIYELKTVTALAALLMVCGGVGCGKDRGNMNQPAGDKWSPGLSDSESATLFDIANDTLDWCVSGSEGEFDFSAYDLTDGLKVEAATFVTLNIDGMLRGCIGTLEPVEAIYKSVHNNAVNASMQDPRFRPVSRDERPRLDVHISILSPIRKIGSLDEFRLGEHGIILEKGPYRAVFLPEVPIEQGWNIEQTLSALSRKAGLPADGWRERTEFSVFSSVVLGDG